MFQLLPQTVVDADGFLQALAQVPDFAKMLFQQVSPCSQPVRTGERWDGESWSLVGPTWPLSKILQHHHPSANCVLSHGHSGTQGTLFKG